ncbi:MAG: CoA pyrophosphatase [Wenzhouxiangellaceae bacterium]
MTEAGFAALLDHLRAGLHDLNTRPGELPLLASRQRPVSQTTRGAAVLLPIQRYPHPCLLLTVRSQRLQHHPGQIAFPGGGAHPQDQGPVGTALREAWEEVGLPIELAQPLGYLQRVETLTAFRVTPVVAWVARDYPLVLDRGEVESAFHLPLEVAFDQQQYDFEKYEYHGVSYRLPVLVYGDWRIWGATAMILWQLCQLAQGWTGTTVSPLRSGSD